MKKHILQENYERMFGSIKEDWWSNMSAKQRAAYIKAHPKSQQAQDATDDTAGDPDDSWDDEEGRAKPTGKTDADAWEDDPWDALDAEYDELEKSVGDEPEGGKDESITINGQKYKPIKESVNEAVLTISYQPIFDADKKDKLEKIAKKSGLTIRSRGAQGFTVDGKRANVEKFIKATRGLIEIKESIKESKTSNPRKFKEIYERTFRSLK